MPLSHPPKPTALPGSVTALATDLLLPTGGRPLPAALRSALEAFFEADFSDVRILEGPHVQALGARAFTLGADLHFAPGEYSARTARGLELLGHELTHVLQQRTGRARNPWGQGGVVLQEAALEAEADRLGRQVAAWLMRDGPLPDESPVPLAARRDTSWQPVPAGALVQCQPQGEALSEASFLKSVAQHVFDRAKKADGSIMEVQATLLNGTLYIASNYTAGEGLHPLSNFYPASFDFWHDKKRVKLFQKADIKTLQGTLHAEQNLLREVAKKLKNKEALTRVAVIGTKRPCSYCRRVLRAFNTALGVHYPNLAFHFVDRTGKSLPAAVDCLVLDPGNEENPYRQFATRYTTEVGTLIPFHAALAVLADEALEGNAERTNASAEISYMT